MPARPSTASTCSRSPRTASRRSIRRPGACSHTIPAPGGGGDSGLTWAEGTLWVGHYRDRKIHQVDPETGAVLRTIESNRFVTGVTWVDGELWHATWEGDESELRRIDPQTGEVLEQLDMPAGVRHLRASSPTAATGSSAGGGRGSGKVRAVRRPKALVYAPFHPVVRLPDRVAVLRQSLTLAAATALLLNWRRRLRGDSDEDSPRGSSSWRRPHSLAAGSTVLLAQWRPPRARANAAPPPRADSAGRAASSAQRQA